MQFGKYTFEQARTMLAAKQGLTTTRSYNGFDIIISSSKGYGVRFVFYKDNTFVKERAFTYHPQIEEYYKRYIDEVLLKK